MKKRLGDHAIRILGGTIQYFEAAIKNELATRKTTLYLRKQRN